MTSGNHRCQDFLDELPADPHSEDHGGGGGREERLSGSLGAGSSQGSLWEVSNSGREGAGHWTECWGLIRGGKRGFCWQNSIWDRELYQVSESLVKDPTLPFIVSLSDS